MPTGISSTGWRYPRMATRLWRPLTAASGNQLIVAQRGHRTHLLKHLTLTSNQETAAVLYRENKGSRGIPPLEDKLGQRRPSIPLSADGLRLPTRLAIPLLFTPQSIKTRGTCTEALMAGKPIRELIPAQLSWLA